MFLTSYSLQSSTVSLSPSPSLSALAPQCHEIWESPSGPLSAQLCFALGGQVPLAWWCQTFPVSLASFPKQPLASLLMANWTGPWCPDKGSDINTVGTLEGGVQNEQGGETLQGLVTARGHLQEGTRQRPRGLCLRRKMRGGRW